MLTMRLMTSRWAVLDDPKVSVASEELRHHKDHREGKPKPNTLVERALNPKPSPNNYVGTLLPTFVKNLDGFQSTLDRKARHLLLGSHPRDSLVGLRPESKSRSPFH